MWSPFVLCLVVGLAYASTNPAWKSDTEYLYLVNGRTLTSLHEAADEYSGIFLKAKFKVTPFPDGRLQGKISDAKYAQIQSYLPNGWESEVPESQLNYQPLSLSLKPFNMVMKDGLVSKLVVEKDVKNWEVNIIKSIVSQFQMDVQGKNVIYSPMNNLPTKERFEGVFKTMEETVTGKTETLYEVHRLPEYFILSENWSPPQKLKEGDELVEVIKNKNYTNADERPSYHYGFGQVKEFEPTSNNMGQFFVRESYSRAVLTGQFSQFVIQKAFTVNKIYVNPTFNDKEMGSVISMVNVTLSQLSPASSPKDLVRPVDIGNLVYTYERPFDPDTIVRNQQRLPYHEEVYSNEVLEVSLGQKLRRSPRPDNSEEKVIPQPEQIVDLQPEEIALYQQIQNPPELHQPPHSPLLPYLAGYYGSSIKQNRDFDIDKTVKKIVNEISEEIQNHQKILSESTLNKYTILCSLIRLMNLNEVKSMADEFYTKSPENEQSLAWEVYINALAEAGTGPALMAIKESIESNRIRENKAAEIVATMAHTVRTPTLQYMRQFYELTKKSIEEEHKYLNESAILSYTDLIYKVYVNKNVSHNQFPVHSFGSFFTKEGREFVKSEVIPYLSKQLEQAISSADSRKIHVYMYSLRNIGDRKILEALEPYLEGQKPCSQFQRMLMVLALDRLILYNPVVARSVLYKVYRNKGEIPEVRVVAIYQLFRTNPPVEMLQRMAESTHTEQQESVVAAIKSGIETASLLNSAESHNLRKAAESAKPLLTRKYYAGDHSFIDLRDYIVRNMDAEFDHKFLEFGSQDSNWPKMVNYAVRANANGMYHNYLSVSGMITSVRDLLNVLYRQTENYQQAESNRSQHQPSESQWSSFNVAKLLNYKKEEREQLESVIFSELEYLQQLWSFDNQTLERLPEDFREQEDKFKTGKNINYTMFKHAEERALSFPIEMGLPFLYTFDLPLLIRIEGTVQAEAKPQISSNNQLHKPEQISAEFNLDWTVSTKSQSQLSFLTPFDHYTYIAGFDRNTQVHIPIRAKVEVNVQSKLAEIEFEVKDAEDSRLVHYSTWPYISRNDIMSFSPVSSRPHTKVILPDVGRSQYFDGVYGKEQFGLAFRFSGHHPVQSYNMKAFAEMFTQADDFGTIWQQLWDQAYLKQTELNVDYIQSQSSVRKFYLRLAQKYQYKKQPDIKEEEEFLNYSQLSSKLKNTKPLKREAEFVKHVSSGIKSAQSLACDISFEFQGDKKYEHIFGLAMAKSNAGPKSRTIVYYKKNAKEQQQLAFEVKGSIPNTNALDITYALNAEVKAQYKVRFHAGPSEDNISKISGSVELRRSDARKQYLMYQEPLYQVCKKQMQQDNYQLFACQNLTIESNYLDDIKIELEHEKLKREYIDIIEGIFKGGRVYYYPMTEIKTLERQGNKVFIKAQFQPEDFSQMNVTVKASDEETKFYNISMYNHIVKTLMVPHPVFHLKSRLIGIVKGWQNFRPTCVIDQTAVETFSNRTYPLSLDNKFTVVMQYVPKNPRWEGQKQESVQEQLKKSYENYVVLARQVSAKQKELMITFNDPKTEGKTVEIHLKPNQGKFSPSNPAATVLVDKQKVQFSDQEVADLYNGFVEIYALPNGEVKVELEDVFYLIFDGKHLKLTATSSRLHDSIHGLCGRFSKDRYEDFTLPARCVVRDYNKFIQSYVVASGEVVRQQRSNEFNKQCVRKVLPLYADVISDVDAGRSSYVQRDQEFSGTKLRHRYVEEEDQICFTIRPLPVCNYGSSSIASKNIPVHCIQTTKTALYLKKQIDQGGNPDFSHKLETKKIRMDVPMECD